MGATRTGAVPITDMSDDPTTVCLAMIVKDEAAVIERCLASVRPFVDSWVVCDTGSTDDTPDRVRAAMAGVPGELHHRPWTGFAANRTEVLGLARDRADYTLVIDADHVVAGEPGALRALTADAYHVRLRSADGTAEWSLPSLVRNDRRWRYEGVVHEYLATDEEYGVEALAGFGITDLADGSTGRERRWASDAELLEAELARNPDDTRSVFYLARTYAGLGRQGEAAALYLRRATMGGWEEEVYCALREAGVQLKHLGNWPEAAEAFQRAIEHRPTRVEAVYDYLGGLRERQRHQLAYALADRALSVPLPDDVLFVEPWMYRWGIRFEFSIAAYWVGETARALAACDALLERDDLPANFREATVRNRAFCLERG